MEVTDLRKRRRHPEPWLLSADPAQITAPRSNVPPAAGAFARLCFILTPTIPLGSTPGSAFGEEPQQRSLDLELMQGFFNGQTNHAAMLPEGAIKRQDI
jgi:hypothetical protein